MALETIVAGTSILTTATFINTETNQPVDPLEVTFTYIVGSGTPVSFQYGASAITHPATGQYDLLLGTTGWVATADALAVLQWAGQNQVIGSMTVRVIPPAAVPTYL